MRTLIGAVALTVVAIAVTMRPALAQTAPKPDPASAGIPSCGCDAGDATGRGSGPGYGPYGPEVMIGGGPGRIGMRMYAALDLTDHQQANDVRRTNCKEVHDGDL